MGLTACCSNRRWARRTLGEYECASKKEGGKASGGNCVRSSSRVSKHTACEHARSVSLVACSAVSTLDRVEQVQWIARSATRLQRLDGGGWRFVRRRPLFCRALVPAPAGSRQPAASLFASPHFLPPLHLHLQRLDGEGTDKKKKRLRESATQTTAGQHNAMEMNCRATHYVEGIGGR